MKLNKSAFCFSILVVVLGSVSLNNCGSKNTEPVKTEPNNPISNGQTPEVAEPTPLPTATPTPIPKSEVNVEVEIQKALAKRAAEEQQAKFAKHNEEYEKYLRDLAAKNAAFLIEQEKIDKEFKAKHNGLTQEQVSDLHHKAFQLSIEYIPWFANLEGNLGIAGGLFSNYFQYFASIKHIENAIKTVEAERTRVSKVFEGTDDKAVLVGKLNNYIKLLKEDIEHVKTYSFQDMDKLQVSAAEEYIQYAKSSTCREAAKDFLKYRNAFLNKLSGKQFSSTSFEQFEGRIKEVVVTCENT